HTPTSFWESLQIARQLPRHTTLIVAGYFLHIAHVIRARDLNQPLPGTITGMNPDGVRPFGAVGEIYQYESTASYNQEQINVNLNNRLNNSVSFSLNYSWAKRNSNSDGQGGTLFPINTYDLYGEYGRSIFDPRHRLNFFGTFNLPWWRISLNPFVNAGT